MKKNETLERIRERMKNYVPKPREKYSLASQVGGYIGEYIVLRYLPTLNIYSCQSRNVIEVSLGEFTEYKRLEDFWFVDRENGETKRENWINLRRYGMMLEEKYMPHELVMNVPFFDIPDENLSEVKEGIRSVLWDSDICSYHIESNDDVVITIDDIHEKFLGGAEIILKLDLDKKIHWNGEIIEK